MFETNSAISKSDDLLKEWVSQQDELPNELLEKCIIEVELILRKVISSNTSSDIKKLNKKITEREQKIAENHPKKVTYEMEIMDFKVELEEIKKRENLILYEVNDRDNLTNFVKKIRWSFQHIDSDKAIENLKNKNLELLRKISSVSGAPNTMLGRLLTVIYEKSSESSVNQRCLTLQRDLKFSWTLINSYCIIVLRVW